MDKYLAISFVVIKDDGEEDTIAHCKKYILPRNGEYVWMPHNWDRVDEFGTRSFLVDAVAHHIPNDSMPIVYDNIVVYVTPFISTDEEEQEQEFRGYSNSVNGDGYDDISPVR